MTISPSERHNYLALRLSRYRVDDPFVAGSKHVKESNLPWAGKHAPSLEASSDDVFEVDILGYDLRRILLAEDPLAVANAFFSRSEPFLLLSLEYACALIVCTVQKR